MSTTAITFGDQELSTVAVQARATDRDMHHRPYRFTEDAIKNARTVTGGERMYVSWRVRDHSEGQQLSSGYEAVSLDATTIYDNGYDDYMYYAQPILVGIVDEAQNRGSSKLLDRVADRTVNVDRSQHRDFERQLLAGDLVRMSDLNTWNGFDYAAGAQGDGFLEPEAVGSQGNVVHNQSKGSYSTDPGWSNFAYDIAGLFSTNGLDGLQDVITRIRDLSPEGGMLGGYSTVEWCLNLSKALQSNEQYAPGEKNVGTLYQWYQGVTFKTVQSGHMPNAGSVTTGDPISAYIIDWACSGIEAQSGYFFELLPFRDIGGGHLAKVAFQLIFAQAYIEYFGSSAAIYDGNDW